MPSRRNPLIFVAVLAALVLLVAAGSIAYFAGVFDEKSKFTAAPDGCTPVEPGLHFLGTGFATAAGDGGGCKVVRADSATHTVLLINYKVASSPAEAGKLLRNAATGMAAEVPGVGDEAYRQGELTAFRVSNLMVLCVVITDSTGYESTGTTAPQVKVFEADLASRLAE
ncbi:hypothetical protein BJ973_002193 [Actinoplanes tereljensis]|uniref:Uncharacterized protein n=1 Tax=Paractinoplanes tereljensis TaxID=571912 RepID=A0A919NPU3_9ACTN|nr:hypothetical protein [Actinoplanes tereljensis]GIF21866.1 hypothetical protein Ate02nite_45960 [Actinoplanes tereljensis]